MNNETPEKKITLFPGGFQSAANYGYLGVDIWMGESFSDELKNSDFFIGHSAGASFALKFAVNPASRYIFVNPLVKKRNILFLILRWLKYAFQEGLPMKKFISLKYWPSAFRKILEFLKVDFLSVIKEIPKENITVIRGKKDNFFCDEKSAEIIRKNGIRIIEVNAGHDWSEAIAEAVRKIINM